FVCFFSSRRRHTRSKRDWSSDVCSSDLTGISGGKPIQTGVNASKLAIAAFIIPYMFVLQPELLMIDTNFFEIILILVTAIAGMIAIGAGLIGYWYYRLNWFGRI